MARNRKAWAPLLLVALGLALGVFGLLLPDTGSVTAQATPSATRSLSATSVTPGGTVDVTVTASDFGQFGGIIETLPSDFTYQSGSGSPAPREGTDANGRTTLTFTLFGVNSVSYTAVAPSQGGGDHHFDGVLRDSQGTDHDIGGDNTISVADDGSGGNGGGGTTPPPGDGDPSATRSLSASEVDAGGSLTVNVDVSNYGQFGGLVETLPSGFSYVSSTHGSVQSSGQEVRFTLFGESSVSYTVTASSRPGTYSFSGVLKDSNNMEYNVGGDTDVTVASAAGGPTASRSFPSQYVDPGSNVQVTVSASGYGQFGAVTEDLPSGFTYVSSSLSSSQVSGADPVRFSLFGESSFTYTVTAPTTEGSYTFSGTLRDDQRNDHAMADTTVTVGTAPVTTPDPVDTPVPGVTPEPDGTPTAPTRTPRPTAVPAAPPTPVATEKAEVTAVEGATTVQPDMSATVSSADGMATLMLPNTSRARTYQVMVSSDAAGCSGASGSLQGCASVTSYDAEGNMESGVMLIRRATVVITLDADAVAELGGLPVVFQANAIGAFSAYQQGADGSWGMRRFSMGLTEDGGVTATVTGLRHLGSVALTVDEDTLLQAQYQVGVITPTPVPDPPTATPVPTATPMPEPTATPEPTDGPPVGDSTLPVGIIVVLALTGALMVYTGSRVMRGRRSAAR